MSTETNKKNITIGGETVQPGERKVVMLRMPELYDTSPLYMPIHVINGKKSGPTLCVIAAIHGDELNGIEIIRKVLKSSKLKKMVGTLIAVPVANLYGFLYQDRYLMDRRDLNRSFPGVAKGSLASRLANLITSEIIKHADCIIDLHTGSLHRYNFPQIRADIENKETRALAMAFNAPVILRAKIREGSLRKTAFDAGIPTLLYESGEALRLSKSAIKLGVSGIFNVMRKLGMSGAVAKDIKQEKSIITRSSVWVRAKYSGFFKPRKLLGKRISKGDFLGVIANPMGLDEYNVYSPLSGILIGLNNLPLVHEGSALFHIACIRAPKKAQLEILRFDNFYDMDESEPQLIM